MIVLDDKENLTHLRQKQIGESGARYEVVDERNLSIIKDMTIEINEFKEKSFNRISVTERCITLNDSNFSFENGNQWRLNVQR